RSPPARRLRPAVSSYMDLPLAAVHDPALRRALAEGKGERIPSGVHVEGGSTGQPQQAAPDVDPIVAEMDALGPRTRDRFGAVPFFA
ncbi:MAG: hypothetical protein M3327_09745, partial [Actinomycetota bacterium]|nr:hypothetical protein [Actinomycetota bacterium]